MITIAQTLLPEDVRLNLQASSPEEAIRATASLLREDERVLSWEDFYRVLIAHPPCKVEDQSDFGICIPHARTDVVSEMVISAGRIDGAGLTFTDCSKPVRYIFCIGVPKAMANDYLRIAGALMRIFKDTESESQLRGARTPTEFRDALSRLERKL